MFFKKKEPIIITEHVPFEKSVTIHEHKAPTDESIKLYEELREKALRSCVNWGQINNNLLEDVRYISYEETNGFSKRVKIVFKINGREEMMDVSLSTREMNDPSAFGIRLYSEMITYITNLLLKGIGKEIINDVRKTFTR